MIVSVIFFIGGQVLPTPFAAYSEDEQRYYRYGVARLAAFANITWDLGNEHDFHREVPEVVRLARAARQGMGSLRSPPLGAQQDLPHAGPDLERPATDPALGRRPERLPARRTRQAGRHGPGHPADQRGIRLRRSLGTNARPARRGHAPALRLGNRHGGLLPDHRRNRQPRRRFPARHRRRLGQRARRRHR